MGGIFSSPKPERWAGGRLDKDANRGERKTGKQLPADWPPARPNAHKRLNLTKAARFAQRNVLHMNNAYTCAYSCAKVIRAGNRNKQLSEYLNNEAQIPQARDRSGPDQNDQCLSGQIGHIGCCFLDKPLMNIIHLNTTKSRNQKGQLTNYGN